MPLSPSAPAATLTVTCLLFARYAELFGQDRLQLSLPDGATVADAVRMVRQQRPGGERLPERPLVAVNLEHARMGRVLRSGDQVALLPPLAGG